MLDTRQILQVFLAAAIAVATLWMLSQATSFILSHILVIGAVAMVCAAAGIWYLSPQNVKPRA